MKYKIYLLLILTFCYSCTTKSQSKEAAADPVVNFAGDDTEMNQAIKKAISTFGVFEAALKSQRSKYSYFSIKVPFPTPDGNEHIWVSEITKEKERYFGIVDNLPESTTTIKMGDKIEIKKEMISDWMFVDGKQLRGGYTLRVIRNRMTAEERKEFDKELPFIIGEEE